jgi:hypothetical protein
VAAHCWAASRRCGATCEAGLLNEPLS